MTEPIRLKIVMNKGRHGILMHKLAQIAEEAEKFISLFARDVSLDKHDWLADNFENGSLSFQVGYAGGAPESVLIHGNKALAHIINPQTEPDTLGYGIRKETYLQFARIAHSLDADDSIDFGILDEQDKFQMQSLSKERALRIEREIQRKVEQYGDVQGYITTLFKEGNSFYMKEATTGERVICKFKPSIYNTVWKLLEKRDGIVIAEGWLTLINDEIEYLTVESVRLQAEYQEGDIDKFFGCDPDYTVLQQEEDFLSDIEERVQ